MTRNIVILTLLAVIVISLGISSYVYSASISANASPSHANSKGVTASEIHQARKSPAEFFKLGGKSVVTITPDVSSLNLERGSTAKVVFTISHIGGPNPLPTVTPVGNGIANVFIPASAVNMTTPKERAALMSAHRPIPGAIDLNSLVSFSAADKNLKPGDTEEIEMSISIPRDWPEDLVGETIFFAPSFGTTENYEFPDLMMQQTGVSVFITA